MGLLRFDIISSTATKFPAVVAIQGVVAITVLFCCLLSMRLVGSGRHPEDVGYRRGGNQRAWPAVIANRLAVLALGIGLLPGMGLLFEYRENYLDLFQADTGVNLLGSVYIGILVVGVERLCALIAWAFGGRTAGGSPESGRQGTSDAL